MYLIKSDLPEILKSLHSLVDQFLQILVKTPLNPDDWVCPSGLRIHVSDIYREELAVVGAEEVRGQRSQHKGQSVLYVFEIRHTYTHTKMHLKNKWDAINQN